MFHDRVNTTLVITRSDYCNYKKEITMFESVEMPIRWHEFIDKVSRSVTNKPIGNMKVTSMLRKNHILVAWHPSLLVLIWSALRKQLVYFCWGMPRQERGPIAILKKLKLYLIINRATFVLVNDDITKNQLQNIRSGKVVKIPHIVDTEYYRNIRETGTDNYILVPGNNDRDEYLVKEISRRGYNIVRVFNRSNIEQYYRDCVHNGLVTIEKGVSYTRLKELYEGAKMVLIPIMSTNHAAGQTSLLESLSMERPAVITKGRLTSIKADRKRGGIYEVEGNNVYAWIEKIEEVKKVCKEGNIEKSIYQSVRNEHSINSVKNKFVEILCGKK